MEIILLSLSKDNSFNFPQSSKEVFNKNGIHSGFCFNLSNIIIYLELLSSLISIPYSFNLFLFSLIESISLLSLKDLVIFLISVEN